MYIDSLLQQKDYLLQQMKDLLLVNDTYNLQKIKNEYDYIINKIDDLKLGRIKTNYIGNLSNTINTLNTINGSSNCSFVSFKNKINPKHAKYIKEFKNPVEDYNFLLENKKEITINTISENVKQKENFSEIESGFNGINGDGLKIKDSCEDNYPEMQYNNESGYTESNGYNDYSDY